MDSTPNLSLPYLMAAQAQKHVTHNEAIRALDAIVQISVVDKDLTTPPSSPTNGTRYLVPPGASGPWSGHANAIAAFQDGAWAFYVPQTGWLAWITDESRLYVFDDGVWTEVSGGAGGGDGEFDILGVNATADATNKLAVASAAVLFNNIGDDVQIKVNKEAFGDTASLLFQTGFSGRAEMGTAGDDDFHFKVSPDGSTWHEAIVIDRATGEVEFPNTSAGSGSGSVTSVGLTAPSGFSVSGSPVTGSGTLALSHASGYQGYTSAEASKLAGIQAGAQVNPDLSGYAPTNREITAGAGLTGGGDLTANRSIALSTGAQASLALADTAVQPAALTPYLTAASAAASYQPLDSDLTALAALTTDSFGRGVLTRTSAAAVQTYIGVREVLAANRDYYVRTDGNDSNTGLANTSGAAFRTIQKAIDVAVSLDLSIYNVTIRVADGTYTGTVRLKPIIGNGIITIQGNPSTPANCIISVASADAVASASGVTATGWIVTGFKITTSVFGYCVTMDNGSAVTLGAIDFGTADGHCYASRGARITFSSNYTISGSAQFHWFAADNGIVYPRGWTVTLSGTPAFNTIAFAVAARGGVIHAASMTFSGSATGVRYNATGAGIIETFSAGSNYFPGNSSGVATSPGAYV